jgi:hypothetical protein
VYIRMIWLCKHKQTIMCQWAPSSAIIKISIELAWDCYKANLYTWGEQKDNPSKFYQKKIYKTSKYTYPCFTNELTKLENELWIVRQQPKLNTCLMAIATSPFQVPSGLMPPHRPSLDGTNSYLTHRIMHRTWYEYSNHFCLFRSQDKCVSFYIYFGNSKTCMISCIYFI